MGPGRGAADVRRRCVGAGLVRVSDQVGHGGGGMSGGRKSYGRPVGEGGPSEGLPWEGRLLVHVHGVGRFDDAAGEAVTGIAGRL